MVISTRIVTVLGLAVLAVVAPADRAAAHTGTSLVAVPAGGEATIALEPTHGCGESPTVAVRIRAPFADAGAGDVDGWGATATPDDAGNTVLEWSGGLLPADEEGAFPVEFTAPDTPGVLLTFPAIQVCENGEQLAWISGDPADEFPAPRVLVLPAGYEPAETIDDVPLDAPGRDQLVAIVDVDNPDAPTPTTSRATEPPPTTVAPTTAAPTTEAAAPPDASPPSSAVDSIATTTPVPATTGPVATTAPADEDDASATAVAVAIAAALVLAAGTAIVLVRRRRA